MEDLNYTNPGRVIVSKHDLNTAHFVPLRNNGIQRAFFITEEIIPDHDEIASLIGDSGFEVISFAGMGEGLWADSIQEAADLGKVSRTQLVIGYGGIKVLQAARAVAAMIGTDQGMDLLLDGIPYQGSELPYIMLPTSFREPYMLKNISIVTDNRNRTARPVYFEKHPAFTIFTPSSHASISPRVRKTIFMDMLRLSIEGYISNKATFLSDTLFLKAFGILLSLLDSPDDDPERDLQGCRAGALLALGMNMSSPGLGTAVAHCLHAKHNVPKAWAGSMMLPHVLEYAHQAVPDRLARIAPILGEDFRHLPTVEASSLVLNDIRSRLGLMDIPLRLRDFSLQLSPNIAHDIVKIPGMESLPKSVAIEDIQKILEEAE
jgi:alcohol dehydrogenase